MGGPCSPFWGWSSWHFGLESSESWHYCECKSPVLDEPSATIGGRPQISRQIQIFNKNHPLIKLTHRVRWVDFVWYFQWEIQS